ncbi:MAG: hypothetical protein ACLTSZ_13290 [Lachnospiraceae bacterium]
MSAPVAGCGFRQAASGCEDGSSRIPRPARRCLPFTTEAEVETLTNKLAAGGYVLTEQTAPGSYNNHQGRGI